MNSFVLEPILRRALDEDIGTGDHAGNYSQPAQCDGDCLQMGCTHPLCSLLAGDCGDPDGPLRRDMDFPLGGQAPSGTQRVTFLGEG